MSNKRDYTQYSFYVTIIVVVILLAINFIPSFKIGKIIFKRTNIISDIIKQEDSATLLGADAYFDTTFLAESISLNVAEQFKKADQIPTAKTQSWEVESSSGSMGFSLVEIAKPKKKVTVPAELKTLVTTEIEDFSPEGDLLDGLYASLGRTNKKRPTRIAIMGDSFIEGDIISADIREQLQTIYSGRGVGFIPFASPLSKYRGTIKHTFNKWKVYNVIQKKAAPNELKEKFFVSGTVCIPEEGAETRLQGVTFRKHIKTCSVAKLLFVNEKNSVVNVVVNDSIQKVFTPESSPYVQEININAEIQTLDISIENVEGFIGYGVVMEDRDGVGVDNYSIRRNSGMALFGTDASINRQINNILGYDLIILQYGLNAMSPNIMNYDSYSGQLVKIVDYIKKCFPESAILIMSVGDRSTLRDGEFVTMPAVPAMIAAQRAAAQKTGIAFWNTFNAMGGENSMVSFVQRNWAAKDYTHIGYAGGKYIGCEFIKSLVKGVSDTPQDTEPSTLEFNMPTCKPQIDNTK